VDIKPPPQPIIQEGESPLYIDYHHPPLYPLLFKYRLFHLEGHAGTICNRVIRVDHFCTKKR
jgi:hypothetical protein